MMKIRFEFVLLVLLLVFSLVKFTDGVTLDDGSSVFAMFSFCCAIRMFSGADDIEGVVTWAKKHRSQTTYWLFGIGFFSAGAVWWYFTRGISFVKTVETVLGAMFFFTAILVVAAWIGDLFSKSKESRREDSQGGE